MTELKLYFFFMFSETLSSKFIEGQDRLTLKNLVNTLSQDVNVSLTCVTVTLTL